MSDNQDDGACRLDSPENMGALLTNIQWLGVRARIYLDLGTILQRCPTDQFHVLQNLRMEILKSRKRDWWEILVSRMVKLFLGVSETGSAKRCLPSISNLTMWGRY